MHNQISQSQIDEFDRKFKQNIDNINIMKLINKEGLNNVCINKDILKKNQTFNIELPETKRMDQKNSLRCWIYSRLNFIKREVARNLNINVLEFELSPTFIAFFDRLEKANSLYNYVIEKKIDFSKIDKNNYFNEPASEKGRFELFKAIVNKYGIVPYDAMKDTKDSLNSGIFNLIFSEKIKKDCIELMNYKEKKLDLYELKNKLLYEDYDLLSKIIGKPPKTFDFSYTNLQKEKVKIKNITPMQFKEKFLKINLNDYISIASMEKYNKSFYTKYKKTNSSNIYKKYCVEYINLPIKRLKELVIKQLKDGNAVIFDSSTTKFTDNEIGILDTELYNYSKFIPFKKLSRIEALNFKNVFANHVMTFTGVQIENNKPIRWKVENSYGKNQNYDGYYIMNDNWFEDYVISVSINKKYLTKKELDIYNSKAITTKSSDAF